MPRRKKRISYSTRRRRACKKVCTVCGNEYPKGKMSPKKYTAHVVKWHTAKVYC